MGIDNRLIAMAGQVPDFASGYISSMDAGLKHGEMERQRQSQNKLSQLLASKPANMPMSEFMAQQGMGDKSLEYGKQEADIAKTRAETQNKGFESHLKQLEIASQFNQGLMSLPRLDKQTIINAAQQYAQQGLIKPEHLQGMQQELAKVPDDDQSLRQMVNSHIQSGLKAADYMKYQRPDANAQLSADTQRYGQDLSANTQMRGQDITALNNERGYKTDMVRLNRDIQKDEFSNALDTQKLQFEKDKLTNPQLKLGETQKKQVIGVQNTKNAIQEYRDQLKGFSVTDLLSPDARAAMGTKYNNMMLQAKEAYNLGVLNGPDFDILQSVITDPRSMKGAITSKGALDSQAKELDRIMSQIQKVAGGDLNAERTGATESYGDDIVNKEAQRLGKDPAKVKAFLDWKAGQK